MNKATTDKSEHGAITRTVQHYVDGAKSGRSDDMKPAFHEDAWIFGYGATGLLASTIQELFDRVDKTGTAPELDKWAGRRFTDFFTLLKVDGEWKIMNKVFHLHS